MRKRSKEEETDARVDDRDKKTKEEVQRDIVRSVISPDPVRRPDSHTIHLLRPAFGTNVVLGEPRPDVEVLRVSDVLRRSLREVHLLVGSR